MKNFILTLLCVSTLAQSALSSENDVLIRRGFLLKDFNTETIKFVQHFERPLFNPKESVPEHEKAIHLIQMLSYMEGVFNDLENLYFLTEKQGPVPLIVKDRKIAFSFQNADGPQEIYFPFEGTNTNEKALEVFLNEHHITKDHIYGFMSGYIKRIFLECLLLSQARKIGAKSPVMHFKKEGLADFETTTQDVAFRASEAIKDALQRSALGTYPAYAIWCKASSNILSTYKPHESLRQIGMHRGGEYDEAGIATETFHRYRLFRGVTIMNCVSVLCEAPDLSRNSTYLDYVNYMLKYICEDHEDCEAFYGYLRKGIRAAEKKITAELATTAKGRLKIKRAQRNSDAALAAQKAAKEPAASEKSNGLQDVNRKLVERLKVAQTEAAETKASMLLLEERLEKTLKEVFRMERQLDEANSKLKLLKASNAAVEKEKEQLRSNVVALKKEIDELEACKQALLIKLDEPKAQRAQAAGRIALLEAQLAEKEMEAGVLRNTIQERTSDLGVKDVRIKDLGLQIASLERGIRRLQAEKNAEREKSQVNPAEFAQLKLAHEKLVAEYVELEKLSHAQKMRLAAGGDPRSNDEELVQAKRTIHTQNLATIMLEEKLNALQVELLKFQQAHAEVVQANLAWQQVDLKRRQDAEAVDQVPAMCLVGQNAQQIMYEGDEIKRILSLLATSGIQSAAQVEWLLNNQAK